METDFILCLSAYNKFSMIWEIAVRMRFCNLNAIKAVQMRSILFHPIF